MNKEEMKNAGYNILENNQNSLETFLKTHHPQVFRDGEFDLNELKNLLNIHTETRGYGLNFVGKSFALQKYSQETKMELKINEKLSKNFGETQNAVIRGDNLDALKILQSNYAGQVKCIYIDPPYNTKSDEFVYSDNFKQSENELLEGYTESEIQRMEGIFKTKKSHSGWLAFMLPRLKLARDLLREDGVIFVSIDDNEQANLKLLMDEVFGEENCLANIANVSNPKGRSDDKYFATAHEYILVYSKAIATLYGLQPEEHITSRYNKQDDAGTYREIDLRKTGDNDRRVDRPNMFYSFFYNESTNDLYAGSLEDDVPNGYIQILPMKNENTDGRWRVGIDTAKTMTDVLQARYMNVKKQWSVFEKDYLTEEKTIKPTTAWTDKLVNSERGSEQFIELNFDKYVFAKPKPVSLIKRILQISTTEGDLVLDFFAGSGTTGQAVMELNHENPEKAARKFILVQWNEEIKEGKEAHKFCVENGLETVISSITIERLRRAGGKYSGDVGFKVFDCIKKTELVENGGQLSIEYNGNDDLSRVYNLVVKSGKNLHTAIETAVEGFIYKAEQGFYVINAKSFDTDAHKDEVKKMFETGQNIYIDGWTASINMTLQQYKSNEKMKIVY